ncbi:MAG: hypothetical protein E6005_09795 [Peptostreptococcus sp.]|uniref:Uncharacterized protein n=2 Tax=Peptostreptococcus anaerobius TaxID=1261 RepID=D3MST6_9FIRM|nr:MULTISPECIES: hypothetical protein [Peptostreptococcus]EFD04865.1 hypothetical protein HMPREF0631_0679 [Peptostreptococcus anaerobius 653-L]KXB71479.1 hypothetical protein HMPREF3183_00927 [Peptostreptococcus anaerobius]KXI10288.1 hypothetical protein HMPREF3195_01874 [Peptostreptococcus anaerobius]MBS5597228.1 hypothetical protein [Peptostreptococcus sp.]MCQ5151327.1 hypothetical protein [Peptostreptococcus anaerobius]
MLGFVTKSGFVFKGRISTNDFALGRQDMKISTFFKYENGVNDYMREQVERFGKL